MTSKIQSAAILDFKNLDISLQRKQISAWSFFKMISVLLALISIICGCHLGRAYMSGSRRENAYVNFDLHKKNSFLYFLYRLFCKCILECLAQNRMRADFSFSDNFGQKM